MNLICPNCGASIQEEKAKIVSTTYLCRAYDGDALWNDVLLTEKTNHTIVLYGGGERETACEVVACGAVLLSSRDEHLETRKLDA